MDIISLFDLTGEMVKPWHEAGYKCLIVDTQHPTGINERGDGIWTQGMDINEWCPKKEWVNTVKMVFAFPPCTHLAVSGAKWFKGKGLGALCDSIKLFERSAFWGDWFGSSYLIENPISTISTYWRKPDVIFNPYEYGGYLPENDVNPVSELIEPRDAYPKKTCLWFGNGFVMPEKKIVKVKPGYSNQHKKLGGKSLRTKNIRSATPRGFARAVFLENSRPDQRMERRRI